jgi:hypothetical protein
MKTAPELRKEVENHLANIRALEGKGGPDGSVIAGVLSEFAQTLSCLSQLADRSTRRIELLTRVLVALTVILTTLTLVQIFK